MLSHRHNLETSTYANINEPTGSGLPGRACSKRARYGIQHYTAITLHVDRGEYIYQYIVF